MTQIDGPWLESSHTQRVCAMLTSAGYQALFVGGCVRNALYNTDVNDIDIATDARPQKVLALAKETGLNAIPTGIDHGTITVVCDHEPFEITTFRKDVETDGRRAVVAFSEDVEDDARRRDFTMNAIYARPNGEVVDPLGGLEDLRARRVRFIDDADQRIREDYLRILRFFRFHAFYGDRDNGMDADALAAIAANSSGIETLSNERIGAEMLKLLSAPDPAPSVAAMRACGALGWIFSGADDRALAPLVHLEALVKADVDPVRRLAALGGQGVEEALRLSKKASKRLAEYRNGIALGAGPAELGYRYGVERALSIILLRSALLETPMPEDCVSDIKRGAGSVFPIQPADLMPSYEGAALGRELKKLEALWVQSDFTLGRTELLSV
ncbi:CCA tRNA nucleotidyltransferase [Shimia aestuarii]|uniref:CCA tRNA nucleotidyltransferase n=1 Tax=Shimia aestuarii TaxID=254406 RepID=UPI003D75629D